MKIKLPKSGNHIGRPPFSISEHFVPLRFPNNIWQKNLASSTGDFFKIKTL